MSVNRSKTITLEITYTYGNPKVLHPWAAVLHGTHGTPALQKLMYSLMYIFCLPWVGSLPDLSPGCLTNSRADMQAFEFQAINEKEPPECKTVGAPDDPN
jgi:hypothetical protein